MTRRTLLSAGTAACILSPGIAASAPVIRLPNDILDRELATVTSFKTQYPIAALTFDDGPHPTLTPKLLDILKARQVRATFYLIGNRVTTWPDIVRRIAAEGHEIGNHSWSHPMLSKLSDAKVAEEIDRTSEAIYRVTGRPPVTFRPPYGAFTRRQRAALYARASLPTILWSVDPQDWRRPGAATVRDRIVSATHNGAIILSHDIQSGTVSAMPGTLDALRGRGVVFATLSQMMGWPDWHRRQFAQAGQARQG